MEERWLDTSYDLNLITVIIPCHNQEPYLPSCLASIVAQDYRPLEVIAVDDGSSDGTGRILREFQEGQKHNVDVKCIFQSNRGAQHARNQGCRMSRGEFIQFIDSDDLLLAGTLSQRAMVLKNEPEVDVVYGDGQYLIDFGIEKKGRIISIGKTTDIIESLLFGHWVPSFSYLSRRSAIQRNGPWDITLSCLHDMEFFLRMAIKGCRFRFEAGIDGLYRKHSLTTVSENPISPHIRQRILAEAESTLNSQGMLSDRRKNALAENYRRIARQVYKKDKDSFQTCLDNVLRLCPQYLPQKPRARLASKLLGLRNYEMVAALISPFLDTKNGWC